LNRRPRDVTNAAIPCSATELLVQRLQGLPTTLYKRSALLSNVQKSAVFESQQQHNKEAKTYEMKNGNYLKQSGNDRRISMQSQSLNEGDHEAGICVGSILVIHN